MKYQANVQFDSLMDADDFAMWVEDVLYAASIGTEVAVMDLSVYEVAYLPGYAEYFHNSPEDPT